MIFDCHTHLYDFQGSSVAEYLEGCEKVDGCFLLASGGEGWVAGNKNVGDLAGRQSKIFGFGAYNPVCENVLAKSVNVHFGEVGLSGAVLYCGRDGFHPCHSRAMRFYEAAVELGLVVFFHNSGLNDADAVLDFARPYLIDEVARTFPELKIIVGGMGRPFANETMALLSKHENVYADLTVSPEKVWQVYNIVVGAHEYDVMDKLLFGSGFPNSSAQDCIETLLGFNKLLADTNLPTVPREQIRGIIERDAKGLLGL